MQDKKAKLKETTDVLQKTTVDLTKTKRNLDENKHLLSEHVRNESVLYAQATELLKLADKTTVECHSLYEKIERKTLVENNNQRRTGQITQVLDKRVDSLRYEENQIRGMINMHMLNLSSKLYDLNAKLTENRDENATTITLFTDEQYKLHGHFESLINNLIKMNIQNSKQAFDTLNQAKYAANQNRLNSLGDRFTQQQNANIKLNECLTVNLRDLNKGFIKFIESFNYKAAKFESVLNKLNKEYTHNQRERISELMNDLDATDSVLSRIRNSHEDQNDELRKQIAQLHDTLKRNAEFMTSEIETLESDLKVKRQKLNDLANEVAKNNSEFCKQATDEFNDNFNEFINNFNAVSSTTCYDVSIPTLPFIVMLIDLKFYFSENPFDRPKRFVKN